ncbi:acetyl/propionyl/methylcrotonyl-CoA carboxylase subunit alpha [Candidatus Riflebacteria bacterium]
MIKRILIANRGEIALRIIRAAREKNIKVVVPFSPFDIDGPWLERAEQIVPLEGYGCDNYLDGKVLIDIAKDYDCDAIHPGYGFLAEDPVFAGECLKQKICFIGPNPEAISLMGNKIRARAIMEKIGVPVVPGFTLDEENTSSSLEEKASKLGFPVLIKAASGGGGRGMRIVHKKEELADCIASAQREAEVAFNDKTVYIEKYLQKPRHIEIQIAGDSKGKVLAFFERECSIQRRHQKLIEEAPSPFVDECMRQQMIEAAVNAATGINYDNVGTVEFVAGRDGEKKVFYFLEVNTRIQVEHPVTEFITGVDLVKLQIELACGSQIPFEQGELKINGHSIECRINAEDPYNNFRPTVGEITHFLNPGGAFVRFDSALRAGYTIPSQYDSLLGKLVVWGPDRATAIGKMRAALSELKIGGIVTTADFCSRLLNHPDFQKGEVDTHFIPQAMPELLSTLESEQKALLPEAAIAAFLLEDRLKKSSATFPDRRGFQANRWNKLFRYDNLKSTLTR